MVDTVEMSLNIKSDEAHRLAREVAARTGETMTEAVTAALKERLERLDSLPSSADEKLERLRAVSLRAAPLANSLPRSTEANAFLYDDRGLPA
ncbi:MAG: antitoxin VapB [Actinomycetota bacterium]|nr:antitoxin VapB [Actinomycetota bacterium]